MTSYKLFQQNCSVLYKHQPEIFKLLTSEPITFSETGVEPNPMQSRSLSSAVMTSMNNGMDFLYLIGIGDGEVLNYCAPEITRINRGVMLIEPDANVFAQAMYCTDLRKLFMNKRIFWVVGERVERKLKSTIDATWSFMAEKPMVHSGTVPQSEEEQKNSEQIVELIKNYSQLRKQAFARQLQALPQKLADKKPAEKIKIWSFLDLRERASYSLIQHVLIRTIFYYLQKKGFQAQYTVLRPGHYYPPYYRHYQMAWSEPDIIFLCNDSPAFETALGKELARKLPIPKLTWFADDPIHGEHLFQRNGVAKDEYFLVADYEWKDPIIENGVTNPVHHLPGAATKTRKGKKRGSRQCDIVFVGQVRDQRHFFANLPPNWKSWAEQVIAEKIRSPRTKIREVMNRHAPPSSIPQDRMDELRQKILWEANTRFRVQVIAQLLKYDLHLYGNPDWLAFLPKDAAKNCYKGVARFQHLFEIYRNAKITLNIHSLQSYTCLNVRDFDVPAAGGFLLSDWLPHADEIFIPGFIQDIQQEDSLLNNNHEMFFYRSIPELVKLTEFFLQYDEARTTVAERAREKVINQHTYKHRAEWLASYIRQIINK